MTQAASGSTSTASLGVPRLIWAVNHRTLLQSEVPILQSLGWEVFIPKRIPDHDPSYRSAVVTYDYDDALTVPRSALEILNAMEFYERNWSTTERAIINDHFGVFISSFSYYTTPLSEAARHFDGTIVARVFGREHPLTYTELPPYTERPDLLSEIARVGDRFVFGQGYDNLADVEDAVLADHAHTITVPLAPDTYLHSGRWTGGSGKALFLCPGIASGGYYGDVYRNIKESFDSLPHLIFGRQTGPVDDDAVLPYLTDDELVDLYASSDVFIYPSTEPRHLHYSPIEAMVVGTPVLYRAGSMLDVLGGGGAPGSCASDDEIREAATRLIAGDASYADRIRAAQQELVDHFAVDLARRQWSEVLG